MVQPVVWRIIDRADGQFAILATLPSGKMYCRGAFLTLAEAEACVEELRALMTACGAPLIAWFEGDTSVGAQGTRI